MLQRLFREAAAFLSALRVVGHADAIVVTGTGVLADDGRGALGFPYQLFKWALAARLRSRRFLLISVGVEPITHPLARFLVRGALRLAQSCSVRDGHSVEMMRSMGLYRHDVAIYPDLAFSLPREVLSPTASAGARGPVVAVGLFNYSDSGRDGPESAARYADYIRKICDLVVWLREQRYSVRIVIGDLAFDRDVHADVRAALQAHGVEQHAGGYADDLAGSFEEVVQQLAGVDYVIASRFHNVLLSLLLGKPVVSLSYEAKNEALMRQMGLGDYCQTLDGLDPERLKAQFQELVRNAPGLRLAIRANAEINRRALENQYDAILRNVRNTR
jgi:polysaccharide pyruvyl transferase WcaK-like protein